VEMEEGSESLRGNLRFWGEFEEWA